MIFVSLTKLLEFTSYLRTEVCLLSSLNNTNESDQWEKFKDMTPPPSFFKVFIPKFCSQRMKIPSAFTSYMRRQLPDSATFLRDCNGNVWPVEVIREGSDLYFEKGWVRFVEDNGVNVGDFLVFQFSGAYFFDFKHFCPSGCEKETAGSFNFTVKLEELEEEGEDNEEEEEEVGRSDAWIGEKEGDYDEEEEENDAYDDSQEDELYEEEEDDAYDDDEEDEESEEEADHDDVVNEEEDYEEDEEDIDVERIKKETESSGAAAKKVGTSKNWSKGKVAVIDEAGLENRAKKVGGTSDADIFESGLVAPPRNPYFIAQKQKLRNDLCIPTDLVKDYGLKLRPEMNIHDEEGRKWHAEVVIWKDGRVVLKKGWKAFCKYNHVKEDDNCLCEFVLDSRQRVRFLKVRIFRA